MNELLDELRRFHSRAEALSTLAEEAAQGTRSEEYAKAEYKRLKEDIASRHKEFQRRATREVEPWIAATFEGALRKAHIAMRAPTNTSPKNPSWTSAVYDLSLELGYHIASIENGSKN